MFQTNTHVGVRIGAGVCRVVAAGRARILETVIRARSVPGAVVLVDALGSGVTASHAVSAGFEVILAGSGPVTGVRVVALGVR